MTHTHTHTHFWRRKLYISVSQTLYSPVPLQTFNLQLCTSSSGWCLSGPGIYSFLPFIHFRAAARMSSRFSTQGISEWNSDEGAKELLQLGSCAYVLTNLPVAIFIFC